VVLAGAVSVPFFHRWIALAGNFSSSRSHYMSRIATNILFDAHFSMLCALVVYNLEF
jgi:hypothetical protein